MSFFRRFFRFFCLLALSLTGQNALASVPFVRNYTPAVYDAGAQNWAVAQDRLGRMYFGNREGLLIYDSRQWELLQVPNFSTVRTIHVDSISDRIYVGASEEFGYFRLDSVTGKRTYRSLVPTIEKPAPSFTEIWNIHVSADGTYWFQADYKLFRHKDNVTKAFSVEDKITTSALIDGRLYAGLLHRGLMQFDGKALVPVPGTETLVGKRIVAILPYASNNILIVTAFNGIYRIRNGQLEQFDSYVSAYLEENQAFCACICAANNHYAFGTVNGGVVLMNSPEDVTIINMDNGMQNNTVLNLSFDRNGNLWMALDNGIDFTISASSIRELLSPSWNFGAGYASYFADNTLLLGTNQGLYSIPYAPGRQSFKAPEKHALIKGQIWGIDTIAGQIMVSADGGLYFGKGVQFQQIGGINGAMSVQTLSGNPDLALASTYDGFALLRREGGKWLFSNYIEGLNDVVGKFFQDENGDIWIAHWMRGIYRLRLDPERRSFSSIKLYNSADGLPTDRNNIINVVDGRFVFSTEGGFFKFNRSTSRFEPDDHYNGLLKGRHSSRLYSAGTAHDLWCVSANNVWRLTRDAAGQYALDTLTYQSLCSRIIPGSENINFISSAHAIMASQEGFFDIDLNFAADEADDRKTLYISAVYANTDSLIYTPLTKSDLDKKISVSHNLNSLRFEFVMPEYRADRCVEYACMLEGYEDDWGPWSVTGSKEYTQLNEGDYVLHVRARNNYDGTYTETSFPFTIRPPWYRSLPAKILYLLLLGSLFWLGWKAVKRQNLRTAQRISEKNQEELERLQREAHAEALRKDVEISQLKSQQLEHDIRHKSKELSNITMNVIRKNEILMNISGKITKIQEEIAADSETARQLTKIQHLIEENISHDDDWKTFTQNFDTVYENYTKRLTELHPNLNASDLRICCYLKMGLSSKDIAPLIHISYRSVEMTRYRLRKKMSLSRDVNLSDYLQKI